MKKPRNPSVYKQLIILPQARYGTWYTHDEPYDIPNDQIEEYSVYYKDRLVATFWICNNFNNSIHLHHPMDVDIVEYIFTQMEARSFHKKEENTT